MWVQMLLHISGGRADGRPWPAAGAVLEVPDEEGRDLIRARHALPANLPDEPGPDPEPVPDPEPGRETVFREDVAEAVAEVPVAEPDGETPSPSSPKQAWVQYAVSQGANADAAGAMTKADLMSRYGARI